MVCFIVVCFCFVVLLYDQKYQKSFKRIFSPCLGDANQRTACIGSFPLLKIFFRVHELVAGSNAWQVRAALSKAKVGGFMYSAISAIPRVRTYHTKEPSRFVHALSARPLKMQGGRDANMRADGTIKINPISLCLHLDAHPNLNREVCRSLTWHSSESESALERFEPVAVAKLWRDGRGTLFAPVAARRQGRDFKESGKPSLMTFAALFVTKKREKRKLSSSFFAGERCSPLPCEFKVKHAVKRKSYQKEVPYKLSRSAERDEDSASSTAPPSPKGGRKL